MCKLSMHPLYMSTSSRTIFNYFVSQSFRVIQTDNNNNQTKSGVQSSRYPTQCEESTNEINPKHLIPLSTRNTGIFLLKFSGTSWVGCCIFQVVFEVSELGAVVVWVECRGKGYGSRITSSNTFEKYKIKFSTLQLSQSFHWGPLTK